MNGFPFSTVSLHLKYIDFSKLDPLKRAALEFGFGRFFTEELPNDFAREFLTARYAAQEQSGIRIETSEEVPFRYRRFAGDATLPRGRYFSVSDSPVGDDHGTMMKDYSLLVYNLDVAGGVGKKGKDRSGPVSPSREVSSAIRVISSPLPETWYEPLSSHRSVDGHREGLAHGPPGKKCRRFGMRYIGVDVHKTNFVVCLLTAQGKPRGLTFSLDAEGQAAFSRHLRAEDEVAVEVGQNAYYFYEQMCAKVKRAVLVDTHRFALISRSKKKTSRQAATLLACFLKLGWLPTVSVPDQRVRQLRQLFQARESLVEMTTKLKNMGHGARTRSGLALGHQAFRSEKSRERVRILSTLSSAEEHIVQEEHQVTSQTQTSDSWSVSCT